MKLSIFIIAMILLFSNLSMANRMIDLGQCSEMSHDSKCWEQKLPSRLEPKYPYPKYPNPKLSCPILSYCTRILTVIAFQNSHYYCEGNGRFDCTQIILKYGKNVIGRPVLVAFSQIDTCHFPGACGNRSCKPFNPGFASESVKCN